MVLSLRGIEAISLRAAGHDITLDGTSSADAFAVVPIDVNTATVQVGSAAPLLTTENSGALTINAAGGGDDSLEVQFSAAGETVSVNATTIEVTAGASLKTVNYNAANIVALSLLGNAGSDIFDVTADANTPTIFVDGGDPNGALPGDTLNVTSGTFVTINVGPQIDEGSFEVVGSRPVNFDRMESLGSLNTPGGATVVGTSDNDSITIIARDNSFVGVPAGMSAGEQDFTVAINDDLEILFINTPSLNVAGLGGSDHFVLRTPAPNQAEWNVDVTLNGGPGDDQVTLQTPGAKPKTIIYQPTGADQGLITIRQKDAQDMAVDSNITLASFADSPGGIERFVLDGQGGNDTLVVRGDGVGPDSADTFVRMVGAAADEGEIRVNGLLPIEYLNLGPIAKLNLDGGSSDATDRLIQWGTPLDDTFRVATSDSDNVVELNDFLSAITTDIESVSLLGVRGNDTFNVETTTSLHLVEIQGSDAGDDRLNVIGTAGVIEQFIVTHTGADAGSVTDTVSKRSVAFYGSGMGFDLGQWPGRQFWTVEGRDADDLLQLVRGQQGDLVLGIAADAH